MIGAVVLPGNFLESEFGVVAHQLGQRHHLAILKTQRNRIEPDAFVVNFGISLDFRHRGRPDALAAVVLGAQSKQVQFKIAERPFCQPHADIHAREPPRDFLTEFLRGEVVSLPLPLTPQLVDGCF
jgi:hypothetical protein